MPKSPPRQPSPRPMDTTAHVDPVLGMPDHPGLGARGPCRRQTKKADLDPWPPDLAVGSSDPATPAPPPPSSSRARLVGGFRPCLIAAAEDQAPSHAVTSQICVGEAHCRRNHPAAAVLADQQTSEAQLRRRRGLGKGGEGLAAAGLGTSRVAVGGERCGGQPSSWGPIIYR
jgi:hypothetical protein